jgi:phosphohistidine phosphatase SixA
MAGMITGEDCRRKAAQWLDRAQAASDPKTSSSMRRASDAWIALAQQVERLSLRLPRSSAPAGRPARLVKSRSNIDSFHVGDMLRERLRLSDEPPD